MSRRAAFASELTTTDGDSSLPPPSLASNPRNATTANRTARPARGKARGRPAPRSGASTKVPDEPENPQQSALDLHAVAKAAADNAGDDEDTGSQICFICAEPVQYWALGSCNHRTCHTCSIRLRALYKKRECTFCKVSTFGRRRLL